jgi:hypothetical protein
MNQCREPTIDKGHALLQVPDPKLCMMHAGRERASSPESTKASQGCETPKWPLCVVALRVKFAVAADTSSPPCGAGTLALRISFAVATRPPKDGCGIELRVSRCPTKPSLTPHRLGLSKGTLSFPHRGRPLTLYLSCSCRVSRPYLRCVPPVLCSELLYRARAPFHQAAPSELPDRRPAPPICATE